VCADVKLEGNAPLPEPKPAAEERKTSQRLRLYVLSGVAFLMFGAGLAFVSLHNGHNPALWAGAIINLLAAVYCGVRAAQTRKTVVADERADLLHDQMRLLDRIKMQ
jgi:hypothetical protein